MSTQNCPVCGLSGTEYVTSYKATYTCRRCGKFSLTSTAEAILANREETGRLVGNLSGWIREHPSVEINSTDLEDLLQLRTPTVAERAAKLLQELGRRHPDAGEVFNFSFPDIEAEDPSWLAITWSVSIREVQYLLVDYLHDTLAAVDGKDSQTIGGGVYLLQARITPRGHELLEQMRKGNAESAVGFCAMWFAEELRPLWLEGIEPAIRAAGYDAKRIDQHEHSNRIDDEIIAMIRRSRFVVADFTGHRGGVYFEAGFALGLGLRVIWLCREDDLANVHFDTRQYNFLIWKAGAYDDLAKRLQNRIEATLGRGPAR